MAPTSLGEPQDTPRNVRGKRLIPVKSARRRLWSGERACAAIDTGVSASRVRFDMPGEIVQDRLPAAALHVDGVLGFGNKGDANIDAVRRRQELDLGSAIAKRVRVWPDDKSDLDLLEYPLTPILHELEKTEKGKLAVEAFLSSRR